MEILKCKDISVVKKRNGFQLLTVNFEDGQGNKYGWAPRWKDLQLTIDKALTTEKLNNGRHWFWMVEMSLRLLADFANTFKGLPVEAKFAEHDSIIVKRNGNLQS